MFPSKNKIFKEKPILTNVGLFGGISVYPTYVVVSLTKGNNECSTLAKVNVILFNRHEINQNEVDGCYRKLYKSMYGTLFLLTLFIRLNTKIKFIIV